MAHELIHEVYEHAPADLTQAELNVLAVIAYHSMVDQRRCWMLAADMQRRTRQSASALRQAMQRLAARGLDPRVVQSIGRDGRAVYAHRGRACVYRLPDLAAPAGCACGRHPADKGNTKPSKGDTQNPPEGDMWQAPSSRKGDNPQLEGACETSPLQEKGDVSQPERQLSDVALNGRTGEKEGGTTDVTTGPHARETDQPPPRARSRPRPEAPGQLPLTAVVRNDDALDVDDPEPAEVPDGSWCGRPDCRSPEPCGACGRAKDQYVAWARQQAEERTLDARRMARERAQQRAAAIAACALCDHDGYLGRQVCDHGTRPPIRSMAGWQLARHIADSAAERGAARRRERPPTRHRPAVRTRAAS